MPRRLLAAVAAFVLVAGQAGSALGAATAGSGPGGPAASAPIQKGLLGDLASGKIDSFVVEFSAKADLRGASKVKGHTERGKYVLDTLTVNARKSQAGAMALANKAGIKAKSYWLYNEIIVHGSAKQAEQFAKLKGVTAVRAEKIYPLVKPVPDKNVVIQATGDPEWGVAKIRAPEAWDEGILGQGVVVASVDTGVDFTHPALVNQYRGNNGDGTFTHDYNWWDPTGVCGGEPCDNVGHGTHTMGTMVGGDGPGPFTPDVGVAPGARWIAAKGCEDFGCTEESLLSSGQWILAPTDQEGNNPDPSKRPDVVNNSWGGDPNDTFYLATVQAWRAAGIIPVFSSGNPGPFCGEGSAPGDFSEVFSAGATDIDDNIADFSGRGPSPFGKINPDITAPGVDVISSVPGGGYESFSGTSMAAPHTSGTIALILSGKPALLGDLNNYTPVTDAVRATAVNRIDDTCGGAPDGDPNNVYGDGRIDAKAAVDLVASGGTLSGTVTDVETSAPIAGATVSASDGEREFSAVSDASGNYSLFLGANTYLVTATAFGYAPVVASGVTIATDQTTDQDFHLKALPRFTVSGHVRASEDGSPIPRALVRAIGTPVPAATTTAAGAYSLVLPVGDYTLTAAAGGCTEQGSADISIVNANITQDFALFRKIDDFGHGCRPIPFAWVDANRQSALYGDEFVGRLSLPFPFDFYGETYSQVFLADNGYVNFLGPDQFNGFPSAIPSALPPNAAIYPLWQDLTVDSQSTIDYQTIGTSPNRAFVIEFSSMQVFGTSTHVSFEIKLWEDGRIDLLYGNNPANPGDGRHAGIGIENAAGDDALQFSFLDGLLTPNSAFRYEHVPSGVIHGTVVDANDGEPIAGAQITANPGGRTTKTDADGNYSLRLRPGSYAVAASATNYVTAAEDATVVDEGESTIDFVLDASVASVDPTEASATVDFGDTADVNVTLSNGGTATLTWEAKERDQGATFPELPPATAAIIRHATWGRQAIPAGFPRSIIHDTTPGPGDDATLSTIITDPAGDSLDSNDVTTVRAGSDGSTVASMAIDFSDSTPMANIGGYVYFDTDQDPSTGLPAEGQFGLPTQDIGMEYFADLFEAFSDGIVPIWNAQTFELVAVVDAREEGHTIAFDMPLEALGGDDGFINTGMVVGQLGPSDWAPDVGHGTIEPFSDAPWLSESPASGEIDPGGDQVVTLHLGSATLPPGEYHALVVFVTNAPKQTQVPVDVTLTVTLPPEFGAITGTVTDAHSGEPLSGASVVVHTTWHGGPLDVTAATGDDGTYSIVGPSGTWPATYSLDGYVADSHNVTIVKGVSTAGVDASLHLDQPHATIDTGSLTFVLTPGRTGHDTITLGNVDGHEPLTFSMDEVKVGIGATAATVRPSGAVSSKAPAGHVARKVTGHVAPHDTTAPPSSVLVVIDALPWDSDALFRVLTDDGIAFDTVNSDSLGDVDLSNYLLVILANDQPQGFYDNYAANAAAYEAYVTAGGFLWVGAASQGFNGGDFDGGVLPGGATVHDAFDDVNKITDPAHPIVAGMPNPFTGTSASHETFADLPAGTDVIATRSSNPNATLIEYELGAGRVLATAQPYDFGLDNGQDTGQILVNGVPYAYDKAVTADAPWLSESPTTGTVPAGGSQAISITVNSAGLAPGVYRAAVRITTNDPDNARILVPVTLVVPKYQQGVNAGGAAYVDPSTGDLYATDRAFSTGGFGYVGGAARSTPSAIGGTDRDTLYQDLREGMSAYRFAVPNGVYQVDLAFAELSASKAGARVFSVSLEGTAVVSNLDVFAAAGGRRVAYDRTFFVEVTDGILDVSFVAQRGDKPIVNGILVTELPPGSPGN